jgi:hypothetical protein
MHGISRQVTTPNEVSNRKLVNMPVETMIHSIACCDRNKVSHLELLVEEVLHASFADYVIVNAELQGRSRFTPPASAARQA